MNVSMRKNIKLHPIQNVQIYVIWTFSLFHGNKLSTTFRFELVTAMNLTMMQHTRIFSR